LSSGTPRASEDSMNPLTSNPAIAVMYAHQQQAEMSARTQLLRNARLAAHADVPRTGTRRNGRHVPRWAYALRLRVAPH
jgi:hypothetical protein